LNPTGHEAERHAVVISSLSYMSFRLLCSVGLSVYKTRCGCRWRIAFSWIWFSVFFSKCKHRNV